MFAREQSWSSSDLLQTPTLIIFAMLKLHSAAEGSTWTARVLALPLNQVCVHLYAVCESDSIQLHCKLDSVQMDQEAASCGVGL